MKLPPFSIDPGPVRAAAQRVADRCDELAGHSDEGPDRLTRVFCSPAMKSAHKQLESWMCDAGMEGELDAAGNLIGKSGNSKPVFMIGSHLDTVVNAGRFDGMLGVLLGLGVAEVLRECSATSGIELPFDIHVVAFSEEEGVRYQFPFIGSQGIAGCLDPADFDRLDRNSISIRDALREFGCRPEEVDSASYKSRNLIGFMEAHIEQAVVLEEADVPVGVVTAIAGQSRATITFTGMAGHAGTVPHDRRRDALAAAAELVLEIEQLGQQTSGLFATVGDIAARPGLSNVIPGSAELRLDLRHETDSVRDKAFARIESFVLMISESRNVGSEVVAQHTPAVPMDSRLTEAVQRAVVDAGGEPVSLVSGAGHDAMIMAQVAPSCMLFVRCRDGISHHPDEFVSPDDIQAALGVMVGALIGIATG